MIDAHPSFNILRLLKTPGIGVARVWELLEWADNHEMGLEEVLADSKALREKLTKKQLSFIRTNQKSVSEEWDKLQDMQATLISVFDRDYPPRLRQQLGGEAPPLLSILGNKKLLGELSVGFCGSRKASEKGIATARDCADQLAKEGINIVSGYAAGVDMITHQAALECGGTTTVVLAEGIFNFRIKKGLKDLWRWNKVVVVSEFLPGLPWNVRHAMRRNGTICALSRAMILIEAGAKGGSIEAGRKCLEKGLPLYAPVYEGMPDTAKGNRELLEQGARQLKKSRKTRRANIKSVLEAIKTDGTQQSSRRKVLGLGKGAGSQVTLFGHDS